MLLALCERGAHNGWQNVKLGQIASIFNVSKQTALRCLRRLEARGMIKRMKQGRTQAILVTDVGLGFLSKMKLNIERVLGRQQPSLILRGTVTTGMGEGRYYMRQRGYREQFRRKLGFTPFPGTLDLRVDKSHFGEVELLRALPGIIVHGFKDRNRTFGNVKVFPARIDKIECAVVFPERGHHRDIIEVIAPHNLRRVLKLRDGQSLEVRVWTET